MAFLKRLFGAGMRSDDRIGNTEPVCPNCSGALDKMPGRKKRCPHCGFFMYVRTRPQDGQRAVVTEEGAAEIDDQWRIKNGTYDSYHAAKREQAAVEKSERERLTAQHGTPASDADVRWAIFNKTLMGHASRLDWGLYRNTRFEMGEVLRKEGRLKGALQTYLEVCYLDANGPRNCGGTLSPELLREYPPFDPAQAFLAPGVLKRIAGLTKKLQIDDAELSSMYLSAARVSRDAMKLPVDPETAQDQFMSAFQEISAK